MADRHETMMSPPIEGLLNRAGSKFTLVTLGAKRARQINSYFNQLGEGLGAIVPPQVTSVARKPLSIAFEEISADKIQGVIPEPVPEGEDGGEEVEGSDETAGRAGRDGSGGVRGRCWRVDASSSASPEASRRTRRSSCAGGSSRQAPTWRRS
jgi:DNA-directed RNA polymerase subunit omega